MTQVAAGSPFALTGAGQTLQITTPGAGVQLGSPHPYFAILQNDSSLQLTWTAGASSGTIQAWAAAIVEVGPGSPTGSSAGPQTIVVATAGFGSGTLSVSWGVGDEPVPLGYPSTSGVSASAIAEQAAISLGTFAAAGPFTLDTNACPPGAIGLMIVNDAISIGLQITVTGTASGTAYGTLVNLETIKPVFLPYNSTLDPVLQIIGTGAAQLEIYALFSSVGPLPAMSQTAFISPGPLPPYGLLVGGQYNASTFIPMLVDVTGRVVPALAVDANQRAIPLVPSRFFSTGSTATLAAPATGSYYLFDVICYNGSGGAVAGALATGGTTFSVVSTQAAAGGVYAVDRDELHGIVTTSSVVVTVSGAGSGTVVLRYAPGP